MENEIVACISKYVEMTDELEEALLQSTFARAFPKGTVLLKEGQSSNECFFIFRGCIRSYSKNFSEESTAEFYTEEQSVTPSVYGTGAPSKLFYECVEDTIATVGTPELEEEMFAKYPQLEALSRAMTNILMAAQKEEFEEFRHASPEQRYLNFLEKRPGLIQRVPLYQIASYLGMKPESLSRIRRRLVTQSKRPS